VPWAGFRAVVDVVVIYIGAQLIAGLVAVAVTRGGAPGAAVPALLVASPVASLTVALLWLALRYDGRVAPVGGRRPATVRDVGVGVLAGIACLLGQRLIVVIIALLADRAGLELPVVQETFRELARRPGLAVLLVFATVLLAPVAEETIFRGILFQGLRARTGFWLAAVGSAAVFTLAHYEGGGWLGSAVIVSGILPLGVVFAALVERRGSLLPSVVAHATYNALGVATLILTAGQV
jgi:membrane protease YdiL (CAAX protease family)